MAENENLVSIVIDASATEGAQVSVKDANKELARFKRSVDKFKGNLSSFSDTSKDTSISVSKFNSFLKGFSKTLESNMLKMQKDTFKNVEPGFTKNLEGMIDRVLNKVETKVSNKIDKTTGSRSRSEPKSSTNVDAAKPLIAKSQVIEGKHIADAIAEEFAALARGVNGIAQPETKTRVQGEKTETSDPYKSISDALSASQGRHTWASPVDQFAKTMNASIQKFSPSANFKVPNPQPTQKVSDLVGMSISDVLDKTLANAKMNPLEDVVSKINEKRRQTWDRFEDTKYAKTWGKPWEDKSNSKKNEDFYGSSMRREMSSMLITLHILQTFGAHSQVFASAFGLIDNSVGHLLNVILLPALPLIANVAQLIHGIASAFQGLPPGIKTFISLLAYTKIISSLVAAMPLKDFAQGIAGVYNAIKDPDSSRLVKFAHAITEIFNAVTSNLFKAPVAKIGTWLGNTRLGKRITGKKADGGPVNNTGLYLVGERGPELFAPGVSGTIIPNHAFKRDGGGPVSPAPTEAFPSLPGMSDIGSSLLGGAAGGLGAGGLTYLVTGSPQLALAAGGIGAGIGGTIGPQLPGMVGSALGTTLSIPGVQGMIGAVNILTGTVSSILAPMAPLFGVVATTLGVMGGLKGAMGGDAEATTRVGNAINKTVATGTNNIAQGASGNARGGNGLLSAILMRLSGCFRICAGSLAGVVPLPKDVTDTKESVVRTEERLKNVETKTEDIKKTNEEKLKRTEEISNKLTESEKNKTSLTDKITTKIEELKTRVTEKTNETIKTISEKVSSVTEKISTVTTEGRLEIEPKIDPSKVAEIKLNGVLESVDTSKVKKPEVGVKGVVDKDLDTSRVRTPEFYMTAVVREARLALGLNIEFPSLAKIIKAELDKEAKIPKLPVDAAIKKASVDPDTVIPDLETDATIKGVSVDKDAKIPELETSAKVEEVKLAPELLAGGGTEVPVEGEIKEVKPLRGSVRSRIPIVDLPATISIDYTEFQKAVARLPTVNAKLALNRAIYASDFYYTDGNTLYLRNDIPAKLRIAELTFLEENGLKRVGDHLEFDKDIIARVTMEALKRGESVEVPMKLTGPSDEEVAQANTRVKNRHFTSPEVPIKLTTPEGGGNGESPKISVTPEIKKGFEWSSLFEKPKIVEGVKGAGGFIGLGLVLGMKEYNETGKVEWGKLITDLLVGSAQFVGAGVILTAIATALAGAAAGAAVATAFAVVGGIIATYVVSEFALELTIGIYDGVKKAFTNNKWDRSMFDGSWMLQLAYDFGDAFQGYLNQWFREKFNINLPGVIKELLGIGGQSTTVPTNVSSPTSSPQAAADYKESVTNILNSNKTLGEKIAELAQKGVPVDVSMDVDSVTQTTQKYLDTITSGITGSYDSSMGITTAGTNDPSKDWKVGTGNTSIGSVGSGATWTGGVSDYTTFSKGSSTGTTVLGGKEHSTDDPSVLDTLGKGIMATPVGTAVKAIAGIFGHAAGGNVSKGVPSIVGEKGPELFVPTGDGSIIPNDKSFLNSNSRVTTSGIKDNQNTTINMYNNFTVTGKDEKTMFESIMKQLKPELQRMKV